MMIKFLIKYSLDRFIALILLIIISPLLFFISILILIKLGRPILFKQQRPGLNTKPFWILKFRTMLLNKGNEKQYLDDEFRITPFGNFLRNTSLDELPELINILKGEMSFVGPRPLLNEYLPLYDSMQIKRHIMKPGITGWAQINGRNNISWDKKFEYDLWYIKNHSLILDLRILLLTFLKVLNKEGINLKGHATTTKFKGNSK